MDTSSAPIFICFMAFLSACALGLGLFRYVQGEFGRAIMPFIQHFMGIICVLMLSLFARAEVIPTLESSPSNIMKVLPWIIYGLWAMLEIGAIRVFIKCLVAVKTTSNNKE